MKRLDIFIIICLFFVSCTCASVSSEDSPSTNSSGANNDNPSSATGTASITGTVWMPANNPTALPNPQHAIPVFGATVYLSSFQPSDLQRNAVCTSCVLPSTPYALTAHDGSFAITSIPAGLYWIVIEKAEFRRSFELNIPDDQEIVLSEGHTTLPSTHDPLNGEEIPSIALVRGTFDHVEILLAKMGMGQLDVDNRFVWSSEQGVFDVYDARPFFLNDNIFPSVIDLLMDIELMSQYQMILFPCSMGFIGRTLRSYPSIVWQNIREYISRGGQIYATDWSGDYVDNIFPAQMTFSNEDGGGILGGGATDTPASAWDGTNWDPAQFGDADGFPRYDVHHAYAMDDDLRAWLTGQEGPLPELGIGSINAEDFLIIDALTQIQSTQSIAIGTDDEGQPVIDIPKVYVVGDVDGVPTSCPGAGCQPMTVTFEPVGCGRVMYSTYHTTDREYEGLIPQERILMYLMMELGACKSGPIIN